MEVKLVETERFTMCRPDEIQLWWPKLGAFNIPDVGGVILERRLVRQWRRSLYPRHIDVKLPGRWQIQGLNRNARVLQWRIVDGLTVRAITEAVYPRDATEALSWLSDDIPTVALNRHIMFVRTSADTVYVYYGVDLVGHITDGQFKATIGGARARRVNKMIGGIS